MGHKRKAKVQKEKPSKGLAPRKVKERPGEITQTRLEALAMEGKGSSEAPRAIKAGQHLTREDIRPGLEVLVVMPPTEGIDTDGSKSLKQPDPFSGTVKGLAYNYKNGEPHGKPVGVEVWVGSKIKGLYFAKFEWVYLAGKGPVILSEKAKREPNALKPYQNPSLVYVWTDKKPKTDFKWSRKIAKLPAGPFMLAESVEAARLAGSSNPNSRGKSIIRKLLQKGKIKIQ